MTKLGYQDFYRAMVTNKKNTNGKDMNWLKLNWFCFQKAKPNGLLYKENLLDEEIKEVIINKRNNAFRPRSQHSSTAVITFTIIYRQLHE